MSKAMGKRDSLLLGGGGGGGRQGKLKTGMRYWVKVSLSS